MGLRRAGLRPHQALALGRLKTLGRFLPGGPRPSADPLGRVRPQGLRAERPCPAVLRRRLLKAVLEGLFAAEIIRGPDPKIGAVLRELARRRPQFYAFMTGQVLPRTIKPARYAAHNGWYLYLMIAVLCQGLIWHPHGDISFSLPWALGTAVAIGTLLLAARSPTDWDDALKGIKFAVLLVFWLRGTLVPRKPSQTELPLPAPGNADPARPLQLRI